MNNYSYSELGLNKLALFWRLDRESSRSMIHWFRNKCSVYFYWVWIAFSCYCQSLFLTCMSQIHEANSVPSCVDYVSWRSQVHGSWYISKLCEVFEQHCERYDVTTMMVKVNDEVSAAFTKKGLKQCPAPVVTLRKRVYLNNN